MGNNNNYRVDQMSPPPANANDSSAGAGQGGTAMSRNSFDRSSQYRRSKRKRKKDSTAGDSSAAANLRRQSKGAAESGNDSYALSHQVVFLCSRKYRIKSVSWEYSK